MNNETIIISAFPCTGKSSFTKNNKSDFIKVLDSDSSEYSWMIDDDGNKVRNPEFPKNYIKHIKECMQEYNVIFVSSHDVVRKALRRHRIKYTLMYPDAKSDMFKEYVKRAIERGSSETFVYNLCKYWDEWIKSCDEDKSDKIKSTNIDDVLNVDMKMYKYREYADLDKDIYQPVCNILEANFKNRKEL